MLSISMTGPISTALALRVLEDVAVSHSVHAARLCMKVPYPVLQQATFLQSVRRTLDDLAASVHATPQLEVVQKLQSVLRCQNELEAALVFLQQYEQQQQQHLLESHGRCLSNVVAQLHSQYHSVVGLQQQQLQLETTLAALRSTITRENRRHRKRMLAAERTVKSGDATAKVVHNIATSFLASKYKALAAACHALAESEGRAAEGPAATAARLAAVAAAASHRRAAEGPTATAARLAANAASTQRGRAAEGPAATAARLAAVAAAASHRRAAEGPAATAARRAANAASTQRGRAAEGPSATAARRAADAATTQRSRAAADPATTSARHAADAARRKRARAAQDASATARQRALNTARRARQRAAARQQQQQEVAETDVGGVLVEQAFACASEVIAPAANTFIASEFTAPLGGVEWDLDCAAQLQQFMRDECQTVVCAVCAEFKGPKHVECLLPNQVPLQLFAKDEPSSKKMPRPGLSVVTIADIEYCLHPAGVKMQGQQVVGINVCSECQPVLDKGRVPRTSLLYFDAGFHPEQLPPLHILEELIVAVLRVNRFVVVARPAGSHQYRPRDTLNCYLRGHVVAVPNPSLEGIVELCAPLDPDHLAQYISVVILSHARTKEEAQQLAARVQCVQVQPRLIVLWARYLHDLYKSKPKFARLNFVLNNATINKYESLPDVLVPVSVRDNAQIVESEADATAAVEHHTGVRAGYANARPEPEGSPVPQAVMPDVSVDCSEHAPAVTSQIPVKLVNAVLECYPCMLNLPERVDEAVPGNVLDAMSVVVKSIPQFMTWVSTVHASQSQPLYAALDTHLKDCIRQHQLSGGGVDEGPLTGVEECEVVVDLQSALQADLPLAFREFAEDRAASADSGVSEGDSEGEGAVEPDSPSRTQIRNVLQGKDTGVLAFVAEDAAPFPDYDRLWWLLAHPCSFPNAEGEPPEGMSVDFWAPHALQRAPRDLAPQQPMFVLDMFNIRQRHAVLKQTQVQMRAAPHIFADLASMPAEEIQQAIELFHNKKHAKYVEQLAAAPPRVGKLLRALRQVSARVEGTPAWFASLRSQLFGLWHALGVYTAFPTYNPSELHSPDCLRMLGFDVQYASDDFGAPINLPSMMDRWRAVARNPVVCAQFFQTFRRAMWEVLHGWPMDKAAQQDEHCRFGRVRGGADRVECSGRGALHDHALIIQSDLQPDRIRLLQQVQLTELERFMRQISCKQLPDGWYVKGSGPWAANVEGAQEAADFTAVEGDGHLGALHSFPAVRVVLELSMMADLPGFVSRLTAAAKEMIARNAISVQLHAHSSRCQKGGRRGNDVDCAVTKPEEARPQLQVLEQGTMLLRCDHGMLVAHIPALLLGLPCNHTVVMCADISKWRTECMRAEVEGREAPPAPPSLEFAGALAANYIAKYVMKNPVDADATVDYLALAAKCKAVSAYGADELTTTAAANQGRQVVTKIINSMNGRQVVPQALAALYNCRFGDAFLTHKTVAYYPMSFVARMRESVAKHLLARSDVAKDMAQPVYTGDGITYVNAAADYQHRADALLGVPAYFFVMMFEKVKCNSKHARGQDAEDEDDCEVDNAVPGVDIDCTGAPGGDAHAASRRGRKPRVMLPLCDGHAQQLTHALALRVQPHLPYAVMQYPVRPSADAPLHDREAYALTMLSMFMSDRLLQHLCSLAQGNDGNEQQVGVMDVFEAWEAGCRFDALEVEHKVQGSLSVHNWHFADAMIVAGYSLSAALSFIQRLAATSCQPYGRLLFAMLSQAPFPPRPAVEASPQDKGSYAESMLALVMPNALLQRFCSLLTDKGGHFSMWEVFAAWEAECCYPLDSDISEERWELAVNLAGAGYAMNDILRHYFTSPAIELPCVYDRWHGLGRKVVVNIDSLSAAQAEERRRAVMLRRDKLRRAQQMGADEQLASDNDASDISSDEDDDPFFGVDFDQTQYAVFDETVSPADPDALLNAMLTPSDKKDGKYQQWLKHATSTLPGVDFGDRSQQAPTPVAVSSVDDISLSRARECLLGAVDAQRGAALQQREACAQRGSLFHLKGVGDVHVQSADLVHANTPAVRARIMYLPAVHQAGASSLILDPKVHGVPPTVKLPRPPSIADTIALFTLSTEQAFSFVQLADALLLELAGTPMTEPIRMVLTGEPGTGKSQVLKAFEWFCFQHDASDMLLVTAYQWKACLVVANEQHAALSSSTGFKIYPQKKLDNPQRYGDCSETVAGRIRFVFIDEYSHISAQHLFDINKQIQAGKRSQESFAGLHVILCGDLCQHAPVKGLALYADNDAPDLLPSNRTALNLYRAFDRVVFLQEQQRIRSPSDLLFKYTRLFIQPQRPSREAIAELCDALNAKAVADIAALAPEGPRVVCLRNDVRVRYNWALASLHAKQKKVRPIAWRCEDEYPKTTQDTSAHHGMTGPLPRVVRVAIALMKPEDTHKVAGVQYYFPGCLYVFIDNHAPGLGYVNNAACFGRGILLHDGEEDDGDGPIWWLKKPPVAVFVEPEEARVSPAAHQAMLAAFPDLPEGCVPVVSRFTPLFNVALPGGNDVVLNPITGRAMKSVMVKRKGLHLGEGYAVTDYFTQGMSFLKQCFLAHLCPPTDTKGLVRASLFVVLSRWGEWDDVKLIVPLWPEGDAAARERVIDAFHNVACLEPQLRAEIQRLKAKFELAKTTYAQQWDRARGAVAAAAAARAELD